MLAMQQRDSNHWANMTAVVEEIEGAVYRVGPLFDCINKNAYMCSIA